MKKFELDKFEDDVFGRTVKRLEPYSEANSLALLVQLMAVFVNVVGRNTYWCLSSVPKRLRIFALIIGPSAAGGKGTSYSLISYIMKKVAPDWHDNCRGSGVSSGEGIIHKIKDTGDPDQEKRLMVVEPEFSQILTAGKREGSTVSQIIRKAFDEDEFEIIKTEPIKSTNSHVGFLGQITPSETVKYTTRNDAESGLMNRFLFVDCIRTKYLPIPERIPEETERLIVEDLKRHIDFSKDLGEIGITPAGKEFWSIAYRDLATRPDNLFGKITARGAPIVRTLATAFALGSMKKEVTDTHLAKALEVWCHSEAKVAELFGNRFNDPIKNKTLDALMVRAMSRSELLHETHKKNLSSGKLTEALKDLNEAKLIKKIKDRPETWIATGKSLTNPDSPQQ